MSATAASAETWHPTACIRRRGGNALHTSAEHRDPITGTPYHKHVPVRLRPAGAAS